MAIETRATIVVELGRRRALYERSVLMTFEKGSGPTIYGDSAEPDEPGGPLHVPGPVSPMRIALLGNFLPRRCGIATFTSHIHGALLRSFSNLIVDVYAMVDPGARYAFPRAVVGAIDQNELSSYRRAGRAIERSGADILWIQHEFGIFGGPAGRHLLGLLDHTSVPIALTLHTVLKDAEADQRHVMKRLIERASLIIVMAEHARAILLDAYGVPPEKVCVIEHGVPDRPLIAPTRLRRRLGLEDRQTVMTFGLLSPDKGVETMIRALPYILDRCPEALYYVVGATHPHLLARDGERYREGLQRLAWSLGVEEAVRWCDRFLGEDDLLDLLGASDVYVTPYRNPRQITSGTLSYAFALGKPIVSTPYIHASELLDQGRGILVDFDDPHDLAKAVGRLLVDDDGRAQLGRAAYSYSRGFTWQKMVERSIRAFSPLLGQNVEIGGQPRNATELRPG